MKELLWNVAILRTANSALDLALLKNLDSHSLPVTSAPIGMPPELESQFAECKDGLERALEALELVQAEGANLETDMAAWRTMLTKNEVLRAKSILVWIGDRYATLLEPKHFITATYPEESMWTEPPMWQPDTPVLGHMEQLVIPHKSQRDWKTLDASNELVIGHLRHVLDGLDQLPRKTRSRLVNEWALLRVGNEPYRLRTGGHFNVTRPDEYRFASLAEPGPLGGAEADLLGSLLRAYCAVAYGPSDRILSGEHPYQTLWRHNNQRGVSRASELVAYWESKRKELDLEWRRLQREQRVARKREILASGLGFQDELAKILASSGYQSKSFRGKDRGVDLLAQRSDTGVVIGIQAKRLKKPVGSAEVRSLRGAREVNRLDVVVLVSASDFTRDARVEARIHPAVWLVSLDDLLERQALGQDPLFMRRDGRRQP